MTEKYIVVKELSKEAAYSPYGTRLYLNPSGRVSVNKWKFLDIVSKDKKTVRLIFEIEGEFTDFKSEKANCSVEIRAYPIFERLEISQYTPEYYVTTKGDNIILIRELTY